MEPRPEEVGRDQVSPKLMTSKEVSEYLGVALNTLQKWRSRNTGPKYFKYGGANSAAIRYDKADVEKFRAAHTIPTRQETNG